MKHKKGITAASLLLLLAILLFAVSSLRPRTTVVELSNPPRKAEAVGAHFYADQLTGREREVYEEIEGRLKRLEGGMVSCDPPLTLREYARVIACLIYEDYENAYAVPLCGLDAENRQVELPMEDPDNSTPVITNILLNTWSSAFREEQMQTAEDGRILNLDDCVRALEQNDPDRVREIAQKRAEISRMLQEVVDGLPRDAGQRDAVEYFATWIHQNIIYDWDTYKEHQGNKYPMEKLFEVYYTPSSTAAVLEGKAMCVGFAKLLSYFCNEAGVDAHIVFSAGTGANHALTAVTIDGVTAYIDLSSTPKDLVVYMDEVSMLRLATPALYFAY